jgi:hypothetical protein
MMDINCVFFVFNSNENTCKTYDKCVDISSVEYSNGYRPADYQNPSQTAGQCTFTEANGRKSSIITDCEGVTDIPTCHSNANCKYNLEPLKDIRSNEKCDPAETVLVLSDSLVSSLDDCHMSCFLN